MKRDIEVMLTQNIVRAAGNSTTARASAGIPAWLATNYVSMNPTSGSPAAGASGTTAMTESTATASITEAGIKNVIKDTYEAGGAADMILCPPTIKQAISDLAQSVSSLRTNTKGDEPAHVVAAVSVYVSDFGTYRIVSSRNMHSTEHVFFLDMDFWAVGVLRDFQTIELARTGDAHKQMLLYEAGLVAKNEKSSGILADCKA